MMDLAVLGLQLDSDLKSHFQPKCFDDSMPRVCMYVCVILWQGGINRSLDLSSGFRSC